MIITDRQQTNRERLDALLKSERPGEQPRISIYLPTHRTTADSETDPLTFKNLINRAEAELDSKFPRRAWTSTIDSLRALQDETGLWTYATEGLAVLASGDELALFRLQYAPEAEVFVDKAFHIVPLLGYVEPNDEAYMAEIGRDRTRLYVVNRYSWEAFYPDAIATSFRELFDDFDSGSTIKNALSGGEMGVYHGGKTRADEQAKDRDKYFRYLDEAFAEMNKNDGRPVLLAGTKASIDRFRQVAKGRFYLEDSIDQPLDSLDPNELRGEIRRAMEPLYQKHLEKLLNRVYQAENANRTLTKLKPIREAAQEGRVAELIVDQTRVLSSDRSLDHILLAVARSGGDITVLREGMDDLKMPVTAILRY